MAPRRNPRSTKNAPTASSSNTSSPFGGVRKASTTSTRSTKIKLVNKRAVSKSFKPLLKPNLKQATDVLAKFGATSELPLVFTPNKQNANGNPWTLPTKKEAGAAARCLAAGTVLERMRANVSVANGRIEELSNKAYSKKAWGKMVETLTGIYETFFNRRTALLKELEICRAKTLVEDPEIAE